MVPAAAAAPVSGCVSADVLHGLHIPTFDLYIDEVEAGKLDMLIVSFLYLDAREKDVHERWCGLDEPVGSNGAFEGLFEALCSAGFSTRKIGEGNGRALVFYRDPSSSR